MTEYLTTADTAKRFGVVPDTVRLWEKQGRLMAIRTESGMRLFRRTDVERLATERARDRADESDNKRKVQRQDNISTKKGA